MLQKIVDDESPPAEGEEHLAALTAGDRLPWAKARKEFFSKGKNKASLDAIEKVSLLCAVLHYLKSLVLLEKFVIQTRSRRTRSCDDSC